MRVGFQSCGSTTGRPSPAQMRSLPGLIKTLWINRHRPDRGQPGLVSTDANKVTASAWRGTAIAEAVLVSQTCVTGPGDIARAAVHRGGVWACRYFAGSQPRTLESIGSLEIIIV